MIISDLTYLETVSQETEIVGGGSFYNDFKFKKDLNSKIKTDIKFDFDSDIKSDFNKKAKIDVESKVKGNSSTFAFDNEAVGKDSNTQGELNQLAVAGKGSSQNGLFVAAAN